MNLKNILEILQKIIFLLIKKSTLISLDISKMNANNSNNNSEHISCNLNNPFSSTVAIQFGSETSKTSTTISAHPKRNIKDHYEFKDILGTYEYLKLNMFRIF